MRSFRWQYLCVLVLVALLAAGCMPRGGVVNPGWTVVAANEEAVYAALAHGEVLALQASDGSVIWKYPPPQEQQGGFSLLPRSDPGAPTALDAVYGLPVIVGDQVLVASYDKKLYAFPRTSGAKAQKAWEYAAEGAIIGGVTVRDNVAYFGSSDYKVRALQIKGNEATPVWSKPFATGNWVWGTPAVDDKRVYIGSMDHYVYALDRQTGAQVWKRDMGASVPGSVTLAEGKLFVGSVDQQLHVLNAEDGKPLWAKSLGHWVWGEALVLDGYVYVGSLDGKFHGLRTSDGATRWEAIPLVGAVRAGPTHVGSDLIVGTEAGNVYRIDSASGRSEVLFKAEGGVLSTPAVVGNKVYVGTTLGNVYALDAARKGEPKLWVYPPPK